MERLKYSVTCLLILGVAQALEGPPKNKVAEEFRVCQAAKSRGDCIAAGCTFDCHMRTCLPMEYACLMDSTNKCFHLCNDKETCETLNECSYQDATDTCSDSEGGDAIVRKSLTLTLEKESWKFGPSCRKVCIAKSEDVFSNVACKRPPSTRQLCSRSKTNNTRCCRTSPQLRVRVSRDDLVETTTLPPTTEMTTVGELNETSSAAPPIIVTEPPATICRRIEDPLDCRNKTECAYSCDQKKCLAKDQVLKKCSRGCASFCGDSCGCKGHAVGKCEYHVVSGECIPRQPECPKTTFEETECGRPRSFYSVAGVLCYNEKERGDCDVEENVLSVNLNGRRHQDKRGIEYFADHEITHTDFYNGRRKIYFPYSNMNDTDKYLYEGFVIGLSMGREKHQCLSYQIPLPQAGRYELALRMYEPLAHRTGRRMFNIMLHEEVVVPDLDIFALVGANTPTSIVINFNVTADPSEPHLSRISIKGHPKKRFMNSVSLGICVGDCRLDKRFFYEVGNYLVSAFSVVKF